MVLGGGWLLWAPPRGPPPLRAAARQLPRRRGSRASPALPPAGIALRWRLLGPALTMCTGEQAVPQPPLAVRPVSNYGPPSSTCGGGIRTDEGYRYRVPPGRPLCGSPLILGTEAGSLSISAFFILMRMISYPFSSPVLQERHFSTHFLCCTLQARTKPYFRGGKPRVW